MTASTTLDVKVNVSQDVLAYLRRTADARKVPVDEIISSVLADYFDEPDKLEILETMRQSLHDGFAGKVRPVDEVLAELKAEINADKS